jgi:hypothetical protein
MEDALQAAGELKCMQKHIKNLTEIMARMEKRAQDVPEKYLGENNIPAIVNAIKSLSGMVQTIPTCTETGLVTNLAERLKANPPKPPSKEEWARQWMEQKGWIDESCPEDTENNIPTCSLCCENKANVVIDGCSCVEMNACASCILKHYYMDTQQCTKSSSRCPFCKAEFKLSQIMPSKEAFILARIKDYSCGNKFKGFAPICIRCNTKPADTFMNCCLKSRSLTMCAECFFGDVYDREVVKGQPTCTNCSAKHVGFQVFRPFGRPMDEPAPKKRKQ